MTLNQWLNSHRIFKRQAKALIRLADLRLCWLHIPYCWKIHALAHLYMPFIEARLAKCRQISIFAMPVAFTRKYQQIMENTGKYDLQPSTFRLVISIIEVFCLNISFLLVYQAIS